MSLFNNINWCCFPLEQFDIVFYTFFVLFSIFVVLILKKKDNVSIDYVLLQAGLNAYFLLFVFYLIPMANIYTINILETFTLSFNLFLVIFVISSNFVLKLLKKEDNRLLDYFILQLWVNAYFLLFVYYLTHIGNIYTINILDTFTVSFNLFLVIFVFMHLVFLGAYSSVTKLLFWFLLPFFYRIYMFLIYKVSTFTLYTNSVIYDSFSTIVVKHKYFVLKIDPSFNIIVIAIYDCLKENSMFALQVKADPLILYQLADFLVTNDCNIANLVFHLYNYQDATVALLEKEAYVRFVHMIVDLFIGCILTTGLLLLLSYNGFLVPNNYRIRKETIAHYDESVHDLYMVSREVYYVVYYYIVDYIDNNNINLYRIRRKLREGFADYIENEFFKIEQEKLHRYYRKTLIDPEEAHPKPDEPKAFSEWD